MKHVYGYFIGGSQDLTKTVFSEDCRTRTVRQIPHIEAGAPIMEEVYEARSSFTDQQNNQIVIYVFRDVKRIGSVGVK